MLQCSNAAWTLVRYQVNPAGRRMQANATRAGLRSHAPADRLRVTRNKKRAIYLQRLYAAW